jgi:hypothetical protein
MLERDGRIFLVQRPESERRLAGFCELPEKQSFPNLQAVKKGKFGHRIVNDRFRITIWSADTPAELPQGKWYRVASLGQIPLTTITKKALAARFRLKVETKGRQRDTSCPPRGQ